MRQIDYNYIVENISFLSRIPMRVYRNKEQLLFCDPTHFPTDPAEPFIDKFLSINHELSYYITPYDQFYGIIRNDTDTLIIGPTFEFAPSREKTREFMYLLNIKKNYFEQYQQLLNTITHMPLEAFLHELCLIYYFISERKVDLSEIVIYDSYTSVTSQNNVTKDTLPPLTDSHEPDYPEHTAYSFEIDMLRFVTNGDMDGLLSYFSNHSYGQAGKIAQTYIRQIKNLFITSVTLVSRAAISGGLPPEEALSLSDRYIQHSEQYPNPEQVMNLQYHMVMDYTSLVAEIHNGAKNDKFLRSVKTYIREHLLSDLSVDQMAKDLYVSRSYLSTKFKNETGITLSSYIQERQIARAKDYLKNSDKSILEIATYLGFSSQGYFQNVFKKHTGMTPRQFREQ